MGRNNRDQTERMQIYFLSDVLVVVASLNLKVPIKGNNAEAVMKTETRII